MKEEFKTPMTELLEHCRDLVSARIQIDTQGLIHWIEDSLLDRETKMLEDAWDSGFSNGLY